MERKPKISAIFLSDGYTIIPIREVDFAEIRAFFELASNLENFKVTNLGTPRNIPIETRQIVNQSRCPISLRNHVMRGQNLRPTKASTSEASIFEISSKLCLSTKFPTSDDTESS